VIRQRFDVLTGWHCFQRLYRIGDWTLNLLVQLTQLLGCFRRPFDRIHEINYSLGYSFMHSIFARNRLWTSAAVLGILLLTGCAGPAPVTQRIEVPVSVPCVTERPQRPAFEFDKLPADASDGAKIPTLARDWPRGRKYEGGWKR
jgi:hypothetical protein